MKRHDNFKRIGCSSIKIVMARYGLFRDCRFANSVDDIRGANVTDQAIDPHIDGVGAALRTYFHLVPNGFAGKGTRHDVTFVATCELLPRLEGHAALSRLRCGNASSRSESIEGSGSVDGGSLAGYESANVLSIIFSRMAAMSPDATQRSSGSRALSATISS